MHAELIHIILEMYSEIYHIVSLHPITSVLIVSEMVSNAECRVCFPDHLPARSAAADEGLQLLHVGGERRVLRHVRAGLSAM